MNEELGLLIGAPLGKLLILMAPAMLVGLLLILCIYRLITTLGKRFLDNQDRQAAAFEKIADGVDKMREDLDKTSRLNEDIRITVMVMADQINRIEERTRKEDGR
jgi:hypothetical protein